MTEYDQTNRKITDKPKFPSWIIFIVIALIIGAAKGCFLQQNRRNAIDNAVRQYNSGR